MKRLHLLYIPGLGKAHPPVQKLLMKTWRFWGVDAEFFVADWASDEPWEQKRGRLLKKVDSLTRGGKAVGLVSASAGASAALNVYAAYPDEIAGVVLIAGMVNHPEDIWERYRRRNPAFFASAQQAQQSLQSLSEEKMERVMSFYGLLDEFVSAKYSKVTGARNKRLPTIGHAFTIATGMLFAAPFFIRTIKKMAHDL